MRTLHGNCIFTNVAVTEDGMPWWEGIDGPVPDRLTDWRGNPWQKGDDRKAAHPNSRFTAPARQCPSISPKWEDPQGVPISAVIFGGRRARTAPLVFESFDWNHGVFVGASVASETTAAQTGAVGVVRRDPMAMLPFCGYNMGDYFRHWIDIGKQLTQPPQIFRVNWFRAGEQGFLWPGFRENLRVLAWIVARCRGVGEAVETPIGHVPSDTAIDCAGLDLSDEAMAALMEVDADVWLQTVESHRVFFDGFEDRVPEALRDEANRLSRRLRHALVVTSRRDLRAWLFGSPHDDPA
jgi:phosphoenolpyruvate carboxykinase (GTP)